LIPLLGSMVTSGLSAAAPVKLDLVWYGAAW